MKPNSTLYDLMRQSEMSDDDGMDIADAVVPNAEGSPTAFKEKYKEFYTDIKIDIKEDW